MVHDTQLGHHLDPYQRIDYWVPGRLANLYHYEQLLGFTASIKV